MPKPLTCKYFDRLHQMMLNDLNYYCGYLIGRTWLCTYQQMPLDKLKTARRAYLNTRTNYTAGVARVLLETIWEREGAGVAA